MSTSSSKIHNEQELKQQSIESNRKQTLRWWYNLWLVHFGDIDVTQQTFRFTGELSIDREMSANEYTEWMNDKNSFEPKFGLTVNPLGAPEIEKDIWTFNNNKEYVVFKNEKLNCFVIRTTMNIKAEFFESLELESFPFDVQHFQMAIQFRNEDAKIFDDINNIENPLPLEYKFEATLSDFHCQTAYLNLIGWEIQGIQCRYDEKGLGTQRFRIILRRSWTFYFWRVIVILGIISLISNVVFIFGADTTTDKFGFLSTTLLTAIAYMFVIESHLPTLNYLTLLDYYILFVVMFIFVIAVQIVVIQIYAIHNDQYDTDDIDLLMFIINTILWLVIHLIFLIVSIKFYKKESLKIKMAKEDIDGYDFYDAPTYHLYYNKDAECIGSEQYRCFASYHAS